MQDSWTLVIMVLLGVLVGASLPVLFQLFMTLGSARRSIQRIGPKLEGILSDVRTTTQRINTGTTGFDESTQRAKQLLDAVGDLGETVRSVNRTLKPAVAVGTALGPALATAVHALIERFGHHRADAAEDGRAERPVPEEPQDSPTEQGDEG